MAQNHGGADRGTNRRDFLRLGAAAGLGAAVGGSAFAARRDEPELANPGPAELFAAPPMERVRIGFVGVGGMGTHHVRNLLKIDGVDIVAVCDIRDPHTQRAQTIVEEAGFKRPTGYSRGETDFQRMCDNEELDLVFTATPWEWHVPVCVYAMKAGKHAATEVPAATTVEDCWKLVETAEQQAKHCVMMENCCYDRPELLALHLVRKGMLGDVLHGQAGYMHDLRAIKFADSGEGLWRRRHSIERNGNLYPTHGLGPVAQCMNINRGDQFDFLVSISSPSRGLQAYARAHLEADDPKRAEPYALGDVNVSLIKTKQGRTIYLGHDTNLPRPYSRLFMVQGTKGVVEAYPRRVHIEGRGEGHGWEDMDKYFEEFDHPLWKSMADKAAGGGHGGMDFIENYRLIQCLREGKPTDMNVYDATAWSVVTPLSEQSVADRGRSIDFPDFTRGRWKTRAPLGIITAA
jgi:predicted dehydrogenase